VAVSIAILVGTLALTPFLKTSFLGSSGENSLSISQELDPGASLEAQSEAAREVEEVLADVDGVETVQTTIGGEGIAALAGGAGASFSVTTDEEADQEALADTVRDRLDELDSDLTVSAGGAGTGASTIDVVVTAPDDAQLEAAADEVLAAVEATDGTSDVTSNAAAAQPTLAVELQEPALQAGLTDAAVAQLLGSVLQPPPVGQAVVGGVSQDVVVVPPATPGSAEELTGLPLGPQGTLGDVARVEEREVATSITRVDGVRSVTISATPTGDDLGALSTNLTETLDGLDLPEGAEATLAGVTAEQEEAFAQLGLAMLIAIAIVYLVMVGTFRSLLQPLILLVSVPFAATGVILLQLVTGVPLGVPSLIGVLMLIGIVVTNAIVLIDLVNQYREDGQPLMDAVINGGRQRLRPILMTAAATILALTPMAFGVTGGSAFISQPLAIVVIGGLVSSTLLTLVLVPVLYLLAERGRARIGARRERRRLAAAQA
jgi:HAE1 family hydrophobic/amphiphilic exporter-1